jgi:hypothetical protein
MLSEISENEPKLKELLYNCLEQIRATKAALYIAESERQPFVLVTQYGFKDGLRKQIELSDPAIDLLLLKRVPFFLNSLGEDSRFAQTLDDASTSRMMVAPIYSRGRLYGFVDMRDKAAGKPFEHADSEAAQEIAQQFLDLFGERGIFGLSKEALLPPITSAGNIEIPKNFVSNSDSAPSYLKLSNRTIDDAVRRPRWPPPPRRAEGAHRATGAERSGRAARGAGDPRSARRRALGVQRAWRRAGGRLPRRGDAGGDGPVPG